VIASASEISVALKDRRTFAAKVIGSDKETGIALLQIEPKGLTVLPIGDSSAMLAISLSPLAIPSTSVRRLHRGLCRRPGDRAIGAEQGYEDFIQTDAAINPGNSGGALINLKGELSGINTAIVGPSGGTCASALPCRLRWLRASWTS
jgi:S1-C subfamily serine protease